MKKKTGIDIIIEKMIDKGYTQFFGYTGGTIMNFFHESSKNKKINFVMSRHEQGATFMAQGYARASGKIAPVFVTSGPGIMNTLTAIADAKMDSVPMLIFSGQVSQSVVGTDAFQETDVLGVMYPITKWAAMPENTKELNEYIEKAALIANYGRKGPVAIDLPKDVQTAEAKNIKNTKIKIPGLVKIPELKKNDKKIKEFKKLLEESKKPLIIIGHGAKLSQAQEEIKTFVEKLEIPFAETFHGISTLKSDHKLSLGMLGMHGEIPANNATQEADLIIAFGMRFDDRVTAKLEKFAPKAKIVHFEIDFSEIEKNIKTAITFWGDLKQNLEVINSEFKNFKTDFAKEYFEKIDQWKKESEENYQKIYAKKTKALQMKTIIENLSEFTKGKDNIVTDVGQHQMFAAKFYNFQRYNTWFSSGGLGTMGFGLPTSIGVKIARPDEEVWMIVGDGSFQMNIQELAVLKQENLKLNILIFNNSYLGMVRQWQDLFFDEHHAATPISAPDFGKIAEAYDLGYQKITKEKDILEAFKKVKKSKKSQIIEFICDPEELVFPMVTGDRELSDMIKNNK